MCTNLRFVYKLKICLQTKGVFTNERFVYKLKVCLQTNGVFTN